MSRGTMYHIVIDPDRLGGMDESDFCDDLDSLVVDYVKNRDPAEAMTDTEKLKARIMAAGFGLAAIDDEYADAAAFAFRAGTRDELDSAKQNWFRDDLAALKRKVAAIDLKTYATETGPIYDLRQILDETDGDAVYLDMGTGPAVYTLDRFVRNMERGYTYYVDRVTVYMH